MTKFEMTCTCGDVMGVEAENRDEAVAKMKAMMTQEAIDAHVAEKHPGQAMTMADVHMGIDKDLKEVI
jgi:hypothetical protein